MAFLDEDDLAPAEGSDARRYGGDRQRQYLVRRVVAVGLGVLIVILLLLGLRSCLDERKERGFENYLSDLTSAVSSSNQVSQRFFDRLREPPQQVDSLELEAQIASDRSSAEAALQQVEALDVPDELSGAQEDVVLAFELRRDALAGIAEEVPALGTDEGTDATEAIAAEMRALLASDVLYDRGREEIGTVLADEAIAGRVPASQFLPDPIEEWIDETALSSNLGAFAADSGAATPGVHGLALLSTTLDGTELIPGTPITVELGNELPELQVEVENQGDSEEQEVPVTFELSGGATADEGETLIDTIAAGGIETAAVAIGAEPETGVELTLEVTAQPVPGEEIAENNTATYSVTFE